MAIIYGTTGPDKKIGTSGDDLIHGWAKGGVYTSPSGNDTLDGAAGNDSLYGGTGNDSLIGGAGNDSLDGNAGADIFNGGTGNDIYIIDSTGDKVTEAANAGTDTIRSFVSYKLGANLENLALLLGSSASAINGIGNSLNNIITGNDANNVLNGGGGNDTLDGGLGNDTLDGGTGNDTYILGKDTYPSESGNEYTGGTNTDIITEARGEGIDTVQSSVSYTLGANLENLILMGGIEYWNRSTGFLSYASGTGNSLNNKITGDEYANTLNGGAGNDTLNGGDGYDELTGGAGNDYLNGGDGFDELTGGAGNDYLNGGAGNDVVNESADVNFTLTNTSLKGNGTDILTGIEQVSLTGGSSNNIINASGSSISAVNLSGGAGNDTLRGGTGNDSLDGGAGNDSLDGGAGNDTYVIDSARDTITEAANSGTDTVQSSVSYTLGINLENLTLTGTAAIVGTGNSLNNSITVSNAGNDTLNGAAGDDSLDASGEIRTGKVSSNVYYSKSNNVLSGGDGNDFLDASLSTGNNILSGDNGNDFLNVNGEVNEVPNYEGGSNRYIYYSTGNNILSGGNGNDRLSASFSSGNNILSGGAGDDSLDASNSTGNNTLIGGTGNDALLGGNGNDTLSGCEGNDTIYGGGGIDTLIGNAGADTFQFFYSGDGIDNITDFAVVDDTISVSASNFGGGLTAGATITPDQFVLGSAAVDNSDRFIYNQNTGALFFDVDGIGATGQVQFASLSTGLAMTNADILVF